MRASFWELWRPQHYALLILLMTALWLLMMRAAV